MLGSNPWTALWLTEADACKRLLFGIPSALFLHLESRGIFTSKSYKSDTLKKERLHRENNSAIARDADGRENTDSTKSNTLKRTKGIEELDPVLNSKVNRLNTLKRRILSNTSNTLKGEAPFENLSFTPEHRRSKGVFLFLSFLPDLGNIRSGTASTDFTPFWFGLQKVKSARLQGWWRGNTSFWGTAIPLDGFQSAFVTHRR